MTDRKFDRRTILKALGLAILMPLMGGNGRESEATNVTNIQPPVKQDGMRLHWLAMHADDAQYGFGNLKRKDS